MGFGLIISVGSSMNYVVKISWLLFEFGVNRCLIFGIFIGVGMFVMYGDGDMVVNVFGSVNGYML